MQTSNVIMKKKEPIKLKPFQGHIVLYCKCQYQVPTVDFFDGLRKIWAIRCGYDYDHTTKDVDTYIANDMLEIIIKTKAKKLSDLFDTIHRNLTFPGSIGKPEGMTSIEPIIWEYRGILQNLKVREKNKSGDWEWIVQLPEPKTEIFERIIQGEGKYEDYYLIKEKKK